MFQLKITYILKNKTNFKIFFYYLTFISDIFLLHIFAEITTHNTLLFLLYFTHSQNSGYKKQIPTYNQSAHYIQGYEYNCKKTGSNTQVNKHKCTLTVATESKSLSVCQVKQMTSICLLSYTFT